MEKKVREGESFKILLGNFLARLVLARNSVYVDSFMAMKGKDFVGKAPRQNAVVQRQKFLQFLIQNSTEVLAEFISIIK